MVGIFSLGMILAIGAVDIFSHGVENGSQA
jgi:hypothetical protein